MRDVSVVLGTVQIYTCKPQFRIQHIWIKRYPSIGHKQMQLILCEWVSVWVCVCVCLKPIHILVQWITDWVKHAFLSFYLQNICKEQFLGAVSKIEDDPHFASTSFKNQINLEILKFYLETLVKVFLIVLFFDTETFLSYQEGGPVAVVHLRDASSFGCVSFVVGNFPRSFPLVAVWWPQVLVWLGIFQFFGVTLRKQQNVSDKIPQCPPSISPQCTAGTPNPSCQPWNTFNHQISQKVTFRGRSIMHCPTDTCFCFSKVHADLWD